MKKARVILAIVIVLVVATLLLRIATATPATTLQSFEQTLSGLLRSTNVRYVGYKTEAGDQVALPLALRIRQIWPQPNLPSQSAEGVVHYTLESVPGRCRIDCLVRCFRGNVARIIVRYPSAARAEARQLAEALRQSSGGVVTSLYESTGS